MLLSHVALSSAGLKRDTNEDAVGFWEAAETEIRQRQGSIAVIADGVGGLGDGEVASQLAVRTAIDVFQKADIDLSAKQILGKIFEEANLAIYEAGMANNRGVRMATTMTVAIFRDKELALGHVGDSRVYLIRNEEIKRLTDDHSYTGLQLKLRLITEHEARASHLRSALTRSVGGEPFVRFDYKRIKLSSRDRLLQATDGLYCFVNDGELAEGVDRLPLDEICEYLVALAERRGTDDNLSAQIVQVDRLTEPKYNLPLSILKRTGEQPASEMPNEVQIGDVLDSRFRIESVVSRSGMASIYKATDLKDGATVAVKVPHMQFESDPGSFARFQREAEIGQTLSHPNILRFLKIEDQSRPYIVMEFLQGRTLSEIMNEIRPLPIADAVQIASALCDALSHMHQLKVVHRDLKPQNVMVCEDGSIRIMDFGIAKATEMRRITFAGLSPAMGTPDYMAPEQVKGRRGDERTDVYSLGAMLYEMTTGRVPFEGPNPFIVMNSRIAGDPVAPRKRNPQISEQLEEIILHAMEREPAKRYQTAADMKAELDDPDSVRVTGRSHRLRSPKMWKTRWQGVRLIVISAIIPVAAFVVALVVARCHH